ncbi:hypothetical protein D9R14_21470 [Xanthobacter tagetidis]|uniref:HAMP domain-containing protein n=1 Tax=Xanthobacter tagetidis TaxID=60216 RepID=A0A3L6ZZN7_9HYPH|nr:hypothetical protein D9R14_21470 [Xanthobacter tagetidis]
MWLIALFALIAAACVAFGAYFSYVTLLNAHRNAIEARFAITAERLAGTAERASSLGIALPAQTTFEGLLRREAELEPSISAIDVVDERGVVLFSSEPARVGRADPKVRNAVSKRITSDLGTTIGLVELRYDPEALAAGAAALADDLTVIAIPTLAVACLATILVGLLLALGLRRSARRAAEPASWPPAARTAFETVAKVHLRAAPGAPSSLAPEPRT